jgi:hypothetical protein
VNEELDEDLAARYEPVWDALRAIADRLEQDPDKPALLHNVLNVAQEVTRDADQSVLGGLLALFLIPEESETNRQYAARLREEVSG